MGYCFLSAGKLKTKEDFARSMNHNFRREEVANADPAKVNLNKELIKLEADDYFDACMRLVNKSAVYKTRKVRCDAVRALEVMLTYTGTTDETKFNQERWEQKNVEWLREKFGSENVVSAICHNDESTPHIHAIVIPMVNESLNAKHYLGGKKECSKLQTEYASAMSEFGLERGIKATGAKHTDIKKFYGAVSKSLAYELPAVNAGESAHEYRDRANETHKESHLQYYDKINQEKRKTQKVKSDLAAVKEKLNEAMAELNTLREEKKQWEHDARTKLMKAERMEELLCGLKNGSLTDEDKDIFEMTMDRIYEGERKKDIEEMSVEKKAFLMDELLSGIESGPLPSEEREVFSEYMKEVVSWERARRSHEKDNEENRDATSDDDAR